LRWSGGVVRMEGVLLKEVLESDYTGIDTPWKRMGNRKATLVRCGSSFGGKGTRCDSRPRLGTIFEE
jgi:hypothetical protein